MKISAYFKKERRSIVLMDPNTKHRAQVQRILASLISCINSFTIPDVHISCEYDDDYNVVLFELYCPVDNFGKLVAISMFDMAAYQLKCLSEDHPKSMEFHSAFFDAVAEKESSGIAPAPAIPFPDTPRTYKRANPVELALDVDIFTADAQLNALMGIHAAMAESPHNASDFTDGMMAVLFSLGDTLRALQQKIKAFDGYEIYKKEGTTDDEL